MEWKKKMPNENDYEIPKNVNTDCICPKCSKFHIKRIAWTGNGIPRILCGFHKNYSTNIADIPINKGRQISKQNFH